VIGGEGASATVFIRNRCPSAVGMYICLSILG
jgi:hypothetical protein